MAIGTGGSGDKTVLVYHVMLQDHVINESCDFMCWGPSW